MRKILFLAFFTMLVKANAQYAPPPAYAGTSAMHKDSSAFISWANFCNVVRGYQDISDPSFGYATAGDSSMVIGKAEGWIVSLGDGGTATCTFAKPIMDAPGWDFAVFENSFSDNYLELAFVEVSDDGINYFRFPAHSLTDTTVQVGGFDTIDTRKINNLAGKYRGLFGTPFDLAELSNEASLDINNITHVRIVDVIGSINKIYATYDTAARMINDPFPTPFPSGGFDLDAVGVIHENVNSIEESDVQLFQVYPNPANGNTIILNTPEEISEIKLYTMTGDQQYNYFSKTMDISRLKNGMFLLEIISEGKSFYKKILIQR